MKSILTDYKQCFLCGCECHSEHHLVFGNGIRPLAEKDGLKAPICDSCHTMGKFRIHDNPVAEKLSKICGQLAYEKQMIVDGLPPEMARESFRKRYGKSYL